MYIYIYISVLGVAFAVPFLCYLQKLFFSRYVQLKRYFSDEKKYQRHTEKLKTETHFSREDIEN